MEKFIAYLFLLNFAFQGIGCESQCPPVSEPDPKSNASMITLDIYRGKIDSGVSLIYNGVAKIIVLKPNGLQSLDFEKPPLPPPDERNINYNVLNHDIEKIKAEVLNVEKEKVERIENLIAALKDKDLKPVINYGKFDNGIAIKVAIVFSNNRISEFSLINGATENQRRLTDYIFDQVLIESGLNKEQLEQFLH